MNVRIEKTLNFCAGFHYDGSLSMTNYYVKLYMITNCTDSYDHNIALSRIKQFIWVELNNTIFINQENTKQCNLYLQAGLNITTLPAEPVDQIIGMMLYSKLNAIMEDRILINEIEISSDAGDNIVYLHSADEGLGPFVDAGWWSAADLVHCNESIDDTKVLNMHQTSAWRDLEMDWNPDSITSASGNTIVFADFKKSDETK